MTDYEWLTEMNLCHKCRKSIPAPNRKFCFDCLEITRAENRRRYDSGKAKEYQSRRREIYQQKKSAGICIRCNKLATHGIYCYEHSISEKRKRQLRTEAEKLLRHEKGLASEMRRENGLCKWCGEKAVDGLQCCERHRQIFSDAGKKAYEANLRNGNNLWINEVRHGEKETTGIV